MTKRMPPSLKRADRIVLSALLVASLATVPAFAIRSYTDEFVGFGTAYKHGGIQTSPVKLALVGMALEKQCLAEAIYFEARGEGVEGQKAIAEVVLQRTHDHNFPSTVCGVVYQGAETAGHACQFSFACNGAMRQSKAPEAWRRAKMMASSIISGALRLDGETGKAVAFHATNVSPGWSATMIPTAQIGNHIFYRWNPHPAAQPDETLPQSGILLSTGEVQPLPDDTASVSEEVQPHV